MLVEQEKLEIAVLRSRGATTWQVTGMAAVEGILLGAAGFCSGFPWHWSAPGHLAVSAVSWIFLFNRNCALPFQPWLMSLDWPLLAWPCWPWSFQPSRQPGTRLFHTSRNARGNCANRGGSGCNWIGFCAFRLLWDLSPGPQNALSPWLVQAMPQNPLENPLLFLVPTLGIIA